MHKRCLPLHRAAAFKYIYKYGNNSHHKQKVNKRTAYMVSKASQSPDNNQYHSKYIQYVSHNILFTSLKIKDYFIASTFSLVILAWSRCFLNVGSMLAAHILISSSFAFSDAFSIISIAFSCPSTIASV